MAFRQGSNKLTVSGALDGENKQTVLKTKTSLGTLSNIMNSTLTGYINDIKGEFTYEDKDNIIFTRSELGETIDLTNSPVVSKYTTDNDAITVIWVGKNDSWFARENFTKEVPEIIDGMVASLNTDNYLVISITTSSDEVASTDLYKSITQVNTNLSNTYGDKYLDLRRMLIDEGLDYLDLSPTDKDLISIQGDTLPPSILVDTTHPNDAIKPFIAKLIYEKLIELKYI